MTEGIKPISERVAGSEVSSWLNWPEVCLDGCSCRNVYCTSVHCEKQRIDPVIHQFVGVYAVPRYPTLKGTVTACQIPADSGNALLTCDRSLPVLQVKKGWSTKPTSMFRNTGPTVAYWQYLFISALCSLRS